MSSYNMKICVSKKYKSVLSFSFWFRLYECGYLILTALIFSPVSVTRKYTPVLKREQS